MAIWMAGREASEAVKLEKLSQARTPNWTLPVPDYTEETWKALKGHRQAA